METLIIILSICMTTGFIYMIYRIVKTSVKLAKKEKFKNGNYG